MSNLSYLSTLSPGFFNPAFIEGNIDFVGDVHGYAQELLDLLIKMGYERKGEAYTHPSRMVVFLGDYIDRGPGQLDTLRIIRAMTEAGSAIALMGNHELNAIGWYTASDHGYLRPRSQKNEVQHIAFLSEVRAIPDAHSDWVSWFKTLPVAIEHPLFSAAHACVCENTLNELKPILTDTLCLHPDLIADYFNEDKVAFTLIEKLLKGPEVALPVSYLDHDGHSRRRCRLAWWKDPQEQREHQLMLPERTRSSLSGSLLAVEEWPTVKLSAKPSFFGHYWFSKDIGIISPTLACLDYSVAKKGPLVAYRFSGEPLLCNSKFISTAV